MNIGGDFSFIISSLFLTLSLSEEREFKERLAIVLNFRYQSFNDLFLSSLSFTDFDTVYPDILDTLPIATLPILTLLSYHVKLWHDLLRE